MSEDWATFVNLEYLFGQWQAEELQASLIPFYLQYMGSILSRIQEINEVFIFWVKILYLNWHLICLQQRQ